MQYRIERNPLHVRMPTLVDAEDVEIRDVGKWSPSKCRLCRGTRVFRSYAPSSSTEIVDWECDCEEHLILERWLTVRRLTPEYQRLRWIDLTNAAPAAARWAAEYLANADWNVRSGIGVVLHGGSGSGKTSVSTLMVKRLMYSGFGCYVLSAANLMDGLNGYRNPERYERWFEWVNGSDVLLFDDLGKETGNPAMVTAGVEKIVRVRMAAGVPTFITTNLPPSDLVAKYGHAVGDLLAQCSDVHDCTTETSFWSRRDERRAFEARNQIVRPATLGVS